MKARKRNGFTLIELILTMAIIAILGAIASVNFGAIQSNVRLKADTITTRNILKAVEYKQLVEGLSKGSYLTEFDEKYLDTRTLKVQSGEHNIYYLLVGIPFDINNKNYKYRVMWRDRGVIKMNPSRGENVKLSSSSGRAYFVDQDDLNLQHLEGDYNTRIQGSDGKPMFMQDGHYYMFIDTLGD
jgi:prepilin-type N-terminal cleavage/methylation domain-containing protein